MEYNHYVIHLKLLQYSTSTMLQLKMFLKFYVVRPQCPKYLNETF